MQKGADVGSKDNGQETPLHIACENGHFPIAQYLVEKGADL